MNSSVHHRPVLLVVAGPSGAGKSTLCRRLRGAETGLGYSVSYTTRARRGDEVDGKNYHFVDVPTFQRMIGEGAFLEHAEVYGNFYGTSADVVRAGLEGGEDILLEIDVQGAEQLRGLVMERGEEDPLRQGYVEVFIAPPDLAVLRKRLEGRAEDSPAVIERRMENAAVEMAEAHKMDFLVANGDLETAVADLIAVYRACKLRVHSAEAAS